VKTSGLADVVLESLLPFSKEMDVAFIFGSLASGDARERSDVDIMIIGQVQLLDLALSIRHLEEILKRSVNPIIISRTEAEKMLQSPSHFFDSVLSSPKLMLIKNDCELVRAIEARQTEKAHDEPIGN